MSKPNASLAIAVLAQREAEKVIKARLAGQGRKIAQIAKRDITLAAREYLARAKEAVVANLQQSG